MRSYEIHISILYQLIKFRTKVECAGQCLMDLSCGAFTFDNNVCTLLKTEYLFKAGTDLTEVFIRSSIVRGNLFNTGVSMVDGFNPYLIRILDLNTFVYILQKTLRGPHGQHGMDVGMIVSLLMASQPPHQGIYASQLTVAPIKIYSIEDTGHVKIK